MGRPDIRTKLAMHLAANSPMREECQAMYFLIEVRKSCERSKRNNAVLKFYADWAVHARKEIVPEGMDEVIGKLYANLEAELLNGKHPQSLVAFHEMTELRAAIREWLKLENLPTDIAEKNDLWNPFRCLLIGILSDQEIAPRKPLKNAPNVRCIYFDSRSGAATVGFQQSVRGRMSISA